MSKDSAVISLLSSEMEPRLPTDVSNAEEAPLSYEFRYDKTLKKEAGSEHETSTDDSEDESTAPKDTQEESLSCRPDKAGENDSDDFSVKQIYLEREYPPGISELDLEYAEYFPARFVNLPVLNSSRKRTSTKPPLTLFSMLRKNSNALKKLEPATSKSSSSFCSETDEEDRFAYERQVLEARRIRLYNDVIRDKQFAQSLTLLKGVSHGVKSNDGTLADINLNKATATNSDENEDNTIPPANTNSVVTSSGWLGLSTVAAVARGEAEFAALPALSDAEFTPEEDDEEDEEDDLLLNENENEKKKLEEEVCTRIKEYSAEMVHTRDDRYRLEAERPVLRGGIDGRGRFLYGTRDNANLNLPDRIRKRLERRYRKGHRKSESDDEDNTPEEEEMEFLVRSGAADQFAKASPLKRKSVRNSEEDPEIDQRSRRTLLASQAHGNYNLIKLDLYLK